MLGLGVDVADSLVTAVNVFKEIKGEDKIIVAVSNYCKWTLGVISIEVIKGVTKAGMTSISAGKEGGWAAIQNEGLFDSDGTEGYTAWTMDTHSFCVIYWRVGLEDENQPNALGLGCRPFADDVDDWEKTIQDMIASRADVTYLEYREYPDADGEGITQYCSNDVCLRGSLFSASEGQANIEIFPRDVVNVAPSLEGLLTQDIIDSYIDEYDGGLDIGAQVGIGIGAAATAAIFIAAIVVCGLCDKVKREIDS